MAAVVDRRTAGNRRLDAERYRLIEGHVRLAEKIARNRCRWGREDPDDTRSDAFWGLTLAGRAFQPGCGNFAAYAALRIEYAIRRGRQVRSGLTRSAWEQGDRPAFVSLNAPVGEKRGELIDLLPAPADSDEDSLTDALRSLPARECLVVRLRYFRGLTQSEVAPIIGRSQMQVSRIERQALNRLRESVRD
ncbi:MAG: sigma-70 family RNA polymerase sigma factor [Solirubrobacterales bacterium]|nr:sigma-70 family RNA polymerase sigma factor [Solirubrobacterales bacterium]